MKKILILIAIVTIVACKKGNCRSPVSQRPNIIIILADDMGYSDIGCFGGEIPTPNIDKLAENGLRLTKFYNAARCCPSRASLLTGLYPHQAGMGHQNQDRGHPSYRGRITDNATTIAEVLKNGGYKTYQVGKWHVGSNREYWPDKKGFDEHFALIEGAMNYFNQNPWVKGQDSLKLSYNGTDYHTPQNFYATAAFSDTASAFIERHNKSNPFFMYLAYNAPHWPLHAPQEDIAAFRGKFMEGWDTIRENRLLRMKELGIVHKNVRLSEKFHSVPEWNSLSDTEKLEWDLKMALYAAVVANLEKGIGNVVGALKKTGQFENTMIVFLSDNGGCYEDPVPAGAKWAIHPTDGEPGSERSFPSYGTPWANVSNTPFSYFKSYLHEGGIATPLVVQFPQLVSAGRIDHKTIGHIMDLLPTFLDLTGIGYPEKINGRTITPFSGMSLLPAFKGENQDGHHLLFWEHEYNRAVRKGNWKLVSAYKILDKKGIYNQWELYNLADDPTEQINVAQKYPDRVTELENLYNNWARKVKTLSPKEMPDNKNNTN